jgi:hypothetical protein
VRPAASQRKINSTVIRVPLMHGFPTMTVGSMDMRGWDMAVAKHDFGDTDHNT